MGEQRAWTDDELAALSPEQRDALIRRLVALSETATPDSAHFRRVRRLVVEILVGSCLLLIPWIGLLALSLPPRYVADNWNLAWAGFDVALLAGLAGTAWALWRRRQVAVLGAIVTATLLLVDAWFDVLTASTRTDLLISLASAALLELPMAAALLLVGRRLILLTVAAAHRAAGDPSPPPPLWRLPLFAVRVRHRQAHEQGQA